MSRATSHSIGDLWELFEALRFAAPAFQEANGRALMLAREITAVQDTDNEGVWMRSNEQREECARKNHGSNRKVSQWPQAALRLPTRYVRRGSGRLQRRWQGRSGRY